MNTVKRIILLGFVFLLSACGNELPPEPIYNISVSDSIIEFKNEIGVSNESEYTFTVTHDGAEIALGFHPDDDVAGWLSYTYKEISQTQIEITVKTSRADQIIEDFYSTRLRVSAGDFKKLNLAHADIDVNLLVWRFDVPQESVVFNVTMGNEGVVTQSINVIGDTAQWNLVTDNTLLNIDINEGEGESEIQISINNATLLDAGRVDSLITLEDVISKKIIEVPVVIGVKEVSILTSQNYVYLSSIGQSDLTSSLLKINHTSQELLPWSANSDVNWLNLNAIDDKTLLIEYNKSAGLQSGRYKAEINLVADNGIQRANKSISVVLIVKDENIEPVILNGSPNTLSAVTIGEENPSLYLATGSTINTIDLISGELLSQVEYESIPGFIYSVISHPLKNEILITAIETITDENTLEETNEKHYYKLSLDSNELTRIEKSDDTVAYQPKMYVVINNHAFILTEALEIADDDLKVLHWDGANAFLFKRYQLAENKNGLYIFNPNDVSISLFKFDYNPFLNNKITSEIVLLHKFSELSSYRVQYFALSNDLKSLYVSNSDTELFSLIDNEYVNQGPMHNGEFTKTKNVFVVNKTANYIRYDDRGYVLTSYNENHEQLDEKTLQARSVSKVIVREGLPRSIIIDENDGKTLLY